jgi:coenzyme F420-reducing hydrogenase delta subunit
MNVLTSSLGKVGIDPKRIQVMEVPQGNPQKFVEVATTFMKDIKALGPLLARIDQ